MVHSELPTMEKPSVETTVTLKDYIHTAWQMLANDATMPDWLKSYRQRAFDRYSACGLPTPRHEAWKNYPLQGLMNQTIASDFTPPFTVKAERDSAFIAGLSKALEGINASDKQAEKRAAFKPRLVFVNGQYSSALSASMQLEKNGVVVQSCSALYQSDPACFESVLSSWRAQEEKLTELDSDLSDAFALLTSAFFQDGVVIFIPDETDFLPVIEILLVTTPQHQAEQPAFLQQFIHLGKRASASISVQSLCLDPFQPVESASEDNTSNLESAEKASMPVLVNRQICLQDEANLTLNLLLNDGLSTRQLHHTQSFVGQSASLNLLTATLSGKTNRHAIQTFLMDTDASATLNGLDVLHESNKAFHPTQTHHRVANTTSSQLYKSILSQQSTSSFNGTVLVAKHANGTAAEQMNNSLLLSEQAKVWTRPQLQILADDVKCSHGATVGQINADQLFYLYSRGFSKSAAKNLLILAFAADVLTQNQPDNQDTASLKALVSKHIQTTIHADHAV